MAKILCLESSTKNCSVALSIDGLCVALTEECHEQYSHAERLHPNIAACIEDAKLTVSDLDAVAVSKGPGSFTGLRIGVSAAKGLCFGLNIPLIGINSLEVLCEQARDAKCDFDYCIPMLDARRMEVYTSTFNRQGEQRDPITAMIIDETAFAQYRDKKVCFVGDGVEKAALFLEEPTWYKPPITYPSASGMVRLAERAYAAATFEDVAYFEPHYLKEFIAGKPKDLLR